MCYDDDRQTRIPECQAFGTLAAFIKFNLLGHPFPRTGDIFAHNYLLYSASDTLTHQHEKGERLQETIS
jgi:hypothetical protein